MPSPKKRPEREGIMLAYPAETGRVTRLGDSFFCQPKLNGERAVVEWFHDDPVILSSYGNEFMFLDHIKEALQRVHKTLGPVPFDGELYVHGWPRERIDSAVRQKKKPTTDTGKVQYHIFDLAEQSLNQLQRLGFLKTIFSKIGIVEPLIEVYTAITSQPHWMNAAEHFVSQGYEGIILRKKDGEYTTRRNVQMLKFKPTEEDNYVIQGVNEAIDKHGSPKGMIGSFTVTSGDLTDTFDVGAGKLKHSKREELWKARERLIGRILRVKHEKIKTSGGVPICAVAVEVIGM